MLLRQNKTFVDVALGLSGSVMGVLHRFPTCCTVDLLMGEVAIR